MKIALVLLALGIVLSAGTFFTGMLTHRCVQQIVRDIRDDAAERMMRLPLEVYNRNSHGDIISRFVNDTTAIADGLIDGIIQLFTGVVVIVGSLTFMLIISPVVTLVVLAVTSLTFLVAMTVTRLSNRYFKSQQAITGELTGLTEEILGAVETVKAFAFWRTSGRHPFWGDQPPPVHHRAKGTVCKLSDQPDHPFCKLPRLYRGRRNWRDFRRTFGRPNLQLYHLFQPVRQALQPDHGSHHRDFVGMGFGGADL